MRSVATARRGARPLAALVAALALLATACRSSRPPNVILIVIDTMRADRMAAGGATRTVAPFLEELAARGTSFRNAYAQAPWTAGSVASLMTSRYMVQHGVTGFDKKLADDETTLAEVLKGAGYRTLGLSANGLITRHLGVAQGYDRYQTFPIGKNERPNYLWFPARAQTVNAKALEFIDEEPKGAPLFLYVQYMEPHAPYDPPAEYLRALRGDRETPSSDDINGMWIVGDLFKPPPDLMQTIVDFYDASIMAMDTQIARLFDELAARGLLDDALVVVTADHGEGFHEHGMIGHGKSLYEAEVRVPLVIVPPGGMSPVVRDEVVQLVDVAPTILDFAGIAPPATFEGHSLRPLMQTGWRAWFADPPPARPALSELQKLLEIDETTKPRRMLVDPERRKVIRSEDGQSEWFDLRSDPGERDANGLSPQERTALGTELDALLEHLAARATPGQTRELDDATRERLKALGYVR
jgi:arylsulfatase A-like enzyme